MIRSKCERCGQWMGDRRYNGGTNRKLFLESTYWKMGHGKSWDRLIQLSYNCSGMYLYIYSTAFLQGRNKELFKSQRYLKRKNSVYRRYNLEIFRALGSLCLVFFRTRKVNVFMCGKYRSRNHNPFKSIYVHSHPLKSIQIHQAFQTHQTDHQTWR